MKNKIKVKLPTPLSYQKEIIEKLNMDDIKYVSFLKSRQSGGSWLNKFLVSYWGLSTNRSKIGYITPTLKLSKLFYSELVESLKPFIIDSNATDLVIKFKTNTTVRFFSAEQGDAIRGNQFNYTIIDEAAFMNEDVFNFSIRQTWLTIGKKVILCSTPNSNSGFFYNFVNLGLNNEPGYFTKIITIYDNPFVNIEEIEQIKRTIPEKVFRQEYLSEFLDGEGSVFSNFKNCVKNDAVKTNKLFAAIDWGKTNDYTVLTILNEFGEMVYFYRINSIDYTNQVKIIAEKLNQFRPFLTISEENNIGQVVNELLKQQYKGPLKCITLDNSLKKEIIENLIVAFETNTIKIKDEDVLMRELQSFSATYNSQTQNIKYAAKSGLHDDCVISLAYAFYCKKLQTINRVVIR